jgi:hypothetical protein
MEDFMKISHILLISLYGVILIGLSGCASYKSRPLRQLGRLKPHDKTECFVSFDYQIFNRHDCMRYLDRNVIKEGYQPIHITLVNNSNSFIKFSLSDFSFPCASVEEVTQRVYTNTTARAVGYGVAGLFIPIFFIPAIVDGCGSAEANKQLNIDYSQKVLRDQTISPYSYINGLIFVPCSKFSAYFTFTVVDLTNNIHLTLSPINQHIEF